MKRILVLLAGLAIALVGGATASAYPPSEGVLVASETVLAPGEPFEVTLQGCATGETVAFAVEGSSDESACDEVIAAPAGESFVAAQAGGSATGTLTAPSTPGTYTVAAEGQDSGVTGTTQITVVGDEDDDDEDDDDDGVAVPGDDGAAGGLPATGSSSTTPVMQIAGISLLAGLGLVGVAYRRRQTATS